MKDSSRQRVRLALSTALFALVGMLVLLGGPHTNRNTRIESAAITPTEERSDTSIESLAKTETRAAATVADRVLATSPVTASDASPMLGTLRGELVLVPSGLASPTEADVTVEFIARNRSDTHFGFGVERRHFQHGRVDSNGHFSFGELDVGKWRLSCSLRGYHGVEKEFEISTDEPNAHVVANLQALWRLRTFVCDERGRPLSEKMGGDVRKLLQETSPWVRTSLSTPANGVSKASSIASFRAARLPAGSRGEWFDLTIDTDAGVWVGITFGGKDLAAQHVAYGSPELILTLDSNEIATASVACEVHVFAKPGGYPIAGASVTLDLPFGERRTEKTDNAGVVQFRELPSTSNQLTVSAVDFRTNSRHLDVRDLKGQPLVVELSPACGISGQLVDDQNHGVKGSIFVTLEAIENPQDDNGEFDLDFNNFETSADGSFDIRGLKYQRYVLQAYSSKALTIGSATWEEASSVSWMTPVDTRSGSVSGVIVHLPPK